MMMEFWPQIDNATTKYCTSTVPTFDHRHLTDILTWKRVWTMDGKILWKNRWWRTLFWTDAYVQRYNSLLLLMILPWFLPSIVDSKFEKFDLDGAMISTIVQTPREWERSRQTPVPLRTALGNGTEPAESKLIVVIALFDICIALATQRSISSLCQVIILWKNNVSCMLFYWEISIENFTHYICGGCHGHGGGDFGDDDGA